MTDTVILGCWPRKARQSGGGHLFFHPRTTAQRRKPPVPPPVRATTRVRSGKVEKRVPPQPRRCLQSNNAGVMLQCVAVGRVPEWLKGTGCKPVGVSLRWFESSRAQFNSVRSGAPLSV
jgi:hypothetical protein